MLAVAMSVVKTLRSPCRRYDFIRIHGNLNKNIFFEVKEREREKSEKTVAHGYH